MSKRNISSLILSIVSVILLIPGLILPILSIRIGTVLPLLGEVNLHHTKQSILGTIESLYNNNNVLVAFLILLFSVIVPVTKAVLIIFSILSKNQQLRLKINTILGLIGKWSMADVFVVALFIAYLSTSSDKSIHAGIHEGFYYFLSYCILSVAAFQVFNPKQR